MADKSPPIEPLDWVAGLKVVDIGDIRVARGLTRRPKDACAHLNIVFDDRERRIWCSDCEQDLEGYDAFVLLARKFYTAEARLSARRAQLQKDEQVSLVSRAAKALDRYWRRRDMVPVCPHCCKALLPEDVVDKVKGMSKSLAKRLRSKEQDQS